MSWTAAALLLLPAWLAAPTGSLPSAAPAPVHTRLLATSPAAGDTLWESPPELRLLFSGPVEPDLSTIRLVSAEGRAIELAPSADPDEPRAILAAIPDLGRSAWRVEWRTVAADGHPIEGSFAFTILTGPAPPADTLGRERPPPADTADPDGSGPPESEGPGLPAAAAALRGISDGALMGLAGLLAFLGWIAPAASARARRTVIALGIAVPLLLIAHLTGWLFYLSGDGSLDRETASLGLATLTGRVETLRVGLAVIAFLALVLGRTRVAALAALAAVAATGALGHALSTAPAWSIPLKALHVVAAALWLGGLLFLIVGWTGLSVPGMEDPVPDESGAAKTATRANEFRATARRVSSVALSAILVIAATGVLQALFMIPSPAALVRSDYGLVVLVKAAGLAGLALFGARNRFRLLPGLLLIDGPERLRRSVSWEVLLMVGVLLAAGFLAYIPPPD